ncbi:MAG: hypothetical protein ACR2IK_03815 [Chloroflexota bacterium]
MRAHRPCDGHPRAATRPAAHYAGGVRARRHERLVAAAVLPFLPLLPAQILLNNFLYDVSS